RGLRVKGDGDGPTSGSTQAAQGRRIIRAHRPTVGWPHRTCGGQALSQDGQGAPGGLQRQAPPRHARSLPRQVSVFSAVNADIEKIRERDPDVADSGLAAMALALAAEIDYPKNSATSKAMCAARLHDALDRLRELSPEHERGDRVDDL